MLRWADLEFLFMFLFFGGMFFGLVFLFFTAVVELFHNSIARDEALKDITRKPGEFIFALACAVFGVLMFGMLFFSLLGFHTWIRFY